MDFTNILVAACGSLLTFILLLLGVIGWFLKAALSKVESKFIEIEETVKNAKNDFTRAKVDILQKLDEYVNGYANKTNTELKVMNEKMAILEGKVKNVESKLKENRLYKKAN